jgi:hypothetical protein
VVRLFVDPAARRLGHARELLDTAAVMPAVTVSIGQRAADKEVEAIDSSIVVATCKPCAGTVTSSISRDRTMAACGCMRPVAELGRTRSSGAAARRRARRASRRACGPAGPTRRGVAPLMSSQHCRACYQLIRSGLAAVGPARAVLHPQDRVRAEPSCGQPGRVMDGR